MRNSLLALAVCAISVQIAGCKMTHNGSLMKLTSRSTPHGEWVEVAPSKQNNRSSNATTVFFAFSAS
jgi:hypothetical protein